MECLGGNGYVEDSLLPRLYREAPVNAIWEGSGNVMCLDVLRAFSQDRDAAQTMLRMLAGEAGNLPGAREAVARIEAVLSAADGGAGGRAGGGRGGGPAARAGVRGGGPAPRAALVRRRAA